MAVSTRNNIVTNGLVLYLDAANTKSLPAPPSTNLMVWSQDFTQANWLKVRASVTASATTAPDSTLTGTRLVNDTSNNSHYLMAGGYSFTAGETYTVSFYAKAAEQTWIALQINEANVVFPTTYTDLTNGVLGSIGAGVTATVQSVGNGWYRTSITRTVANTGLSYFAILTATANLSISYTGDGTSGVYVWGVQLEKLPYVTPYIPTTSTSVSRNTWSDVSGNGNSGSLVGGPTFDSGNGGNIVFDGINKRVSCPLSPSIQSINTTNALTLSIFIKVAFNSEYRDFVGINKLSGNNPFVLRANPSNQHFFDWEIGGVRQQATYPGLTSDILNKWVQLTATIGNNLVKIYLNGLQVSNTVTVSGSIKTLDADFRVGGLGYSDFKGNVSNTQLYNRALTAQEILQNYNATKTRFNLT